MADALASGASESNLVRVQVPPSAPSIRPGFDAGFFRKLFIDVSGLREYYDTGLYNFMYIYSFL